MQLVRARSALACVPTWDKGEGAGPGPLGGQASDGRHVSTCWWFIHAQYACTMHPACQGDRVGQGAAPCLQAGANQTHRSNSAAACGSEMDTLRWTIRERSRACMGEHHK